jgi:hypothetical protein
MYLVSLLINNPSPSIAQAHHTMRFELNYFCFLLPISEEPEDPEHREVQIRLQYTTTAFPPQSDLHAENAPPYKFCSNLPAEDQDLFKHYHGGCSESSEQTEPAIFLLSFFGELQQPTTSISLPTAIRQAFPT